MDQVNSIVSPHKQGLAVMLVLVLLASVSVAVYFTNRIQRVMTEYGLDLDEKVSYDLMHLQIQFLLGMIALVLIVIVIITLYQKNFNYLYYEARLDDLTGLFGRQLFFQTAVRRQSSAGCGGAAEVSLWRQGDNRSSWRRRICSACESVLVKA